METTVGRLNSKGQTACNEVKVKVQYIQNHQLVEKSKANVSLASPTSLEDEAESVEYLDECTGEEYTVERGDAPAIDALDEDSFYPNAIHCLIALYQAKYEQLKGKNAQQIKDMRIWDAISKDMKESYFDFNSTQVRSKYAKLRQQYFSISDKQDIQVFYYFNNLHDVYNDKRVAAILHDESSAAEKHASYIDDVLFTEDHIADEEILQTHDEIIHKEHEFIDMVEKELLAKEQMNSANAEKTDTSYRSDGALLEPIIKRKGHEVLENATNAVKRQKFVAKKDQKESAPSVLYIKLPSATDVIRSELVADTEAEQKSSRAPVDNVLGLPKEQTLTHSPIIATTGVADAKLLDSQSDATDMSLAAYNAAQQQRHEEKMELLRRSLQIKERAIEMQHQLMEQLVKRL